MAAGLVILALAVLLVGLVMLMSAQRRLDAAQRAEVMLRMDNTRLIPSLALQVDVALEDVRRAGGEIEPGSPGPA